MEKILIVDDEEAARSVFSDVIRRHHFETLQASDGQGAISAFRNDRPDAVLLDLRLPDMDGIEILGALRKIDPDVPVIIVTAYGDVSTAVDAIKAGAYDFVVKPPDYKAILVTLTRAVEIRRLRRECAAANAQLSAAEAQVNVLTQEKRLERDLQRVCSLERQRIGRDLHDDLGQHLTGIAFLAKALEQKLAERGMPEASEAGVIVGLVNRATQRTRDLSRGLVASEIGPADFFDMLNDFAARTESVFGIRCKVTYGCGITIPDRITATNLFFIIQEAVNNAVRHGNAGCIDVAISDGDGSITLTVKDDGKGFPGPESGGIGLGLEIMNYRAGLMNAVIDIRRYGPEGTLLTCSIPGTRSAKQ